MSGATVPVSRPVGRAMIVGNAACRSLPRGAMARLGFQCAEMDDPYAAMAEICRRPLVYRALIISLNSFFMEELSLIAALKRRFPHIEVWLTDIEGRQAALAEALRLGADGLVAEDGLHPITGPRPPEPAAAPPLRAHVEPAEEAEVELEEVDAAPPSGAAGGAGDAPESPQAGPAPEAPAPSVGDFDAGSAGEPVLTAEELRALLQDHPLPRDERADGANEP